MKEMRKKLGDYITQRREKNTSDDLPICGVCREGLIPPKQQDADISLYNVFYKNDFIFNPARMELNSITLNTQHDKAICSSLYEIFYINDTSILLPEFLFVQLKTDNFIRFCEFQGQGSVREYCRFANISEYPVIVPDIKEQQKIVDTYNAITNRIRIKQKINENLEKTAQCLFEELTKDKENFETKTIEEISDAVICGKTPSTTESKYWGNEIPFITIPDMHGSNFIHTTERYLSIAGKQSQEKQTLPKNSICVSCIATVGLVSLTTTESQTNQQINSIICKEGISFYYVFMLLKQMTDELKRLGAGGSTTLNVSKSLFASIKLQLPNEENMIFFDKKVSSLFSKILINEKEIEKLEALKMTVVSQISKR